MKQGTIGTGDNSSSFLIKAGRLVVANLRYTAQRFKASHGYWRYSRRYPNKLLFIAGLPKSGTTWLERLLASYPGFHTITPPVAVQYEINNKESHSFQLPDNFFDSYQRMLLIMKMHLNGSAQNAEILASANIKYVILIRDLRDVAVSYGFYVSQTPWHPEHNIYRSLSTSERLLLFSDSHLADYARWIQLWNENRDPDQSIVITYEELRMNTASTLSTIACHFGIDSSPEIISDIVQGQTLKQIVDDDSEIKPKIGSVVRKGKVGDWTNHFSSEVKTIYKGKIGQILIDLGYESDLNW